jgi:hypothetical protein
MSSVSAIDPNLSLDAVVEIRDGLLSGRIRLHFDDAVEVTPALECWRKQATATILAAYEAEIDRREQRKNRVSESRQNREGKS